MNGHEAQQPHVWSKKRTIRRIVSEYNKIAQRRAEEATRLNKSVPDIVHQQQYIVGAMPSSAHRVRAVRSSDSKVVPLLDKAPFHCSSQLLTYGSSNNQTLDCEPRQIVHRSTSRHTARDDTELSIGPFGENDFPTHELSVRASLEPQPGTLAWVSV